MNNGQFALIKKDIRSITSNKQIFAVLLIVPLVLTIVLPSIFVLVLTQAPDAASDFQKLLDMMPVTDGEYSQQQRILGLILNNIMPPFFLIVPIMASSVMAASSFVGEKEKHTLETLLYSPLSLRQLFQSKIPAGFSVGMMVSYISFAAMLLVVEVEVFFLTGNLIIPGISWLISMLLIAPTFSLVAIAVTVRSSAKAKTIEEAQQRAVFLIFPILALVIGQFTGILLINSWLLLGLGAVLVVLDVLLMRNAAGLTAWIVNHQDVIPGFVNRLAHLFFFVFMDLTIIITAEYMYEQLIGIDKNKTKALFLRRIPGVLSLLLITAGIGKLGYIRGRTTWYSMGFSVYVCYGTIIFYYGMILFLVITRHRFLPKEKVMGTLSFILIAGLILAVQIRFPEVLLTSIFPTVLLLGIYIDFENPFIRKQTVHNEEMLDGFATMVENRDYNTGGHIKRTRAYVNLLLEKMRDDRYYRNILNKDYMLNVIYAAPLHDIGKIATPDSILQKSGKLTAAEYEIMKQHAATGGDIILQTFYNLDDADFRQIAYEVARFHHEKFNGKGYPDGLAGEQIPLHARIMAIADVFDAVSQKRCYRDAMPLEESFSIIEKGSGSDFDPRLVKIFLAAKEEVKELMEAIERKGEE